MRLSDLGTPFRRWLGLPQGGGAAPLPDPEPLEKHRDREWKRFMAPLIVDGVRPRDVRQGKIADCFLAAALASVAHHRPDAIKRSVTRLPDAGHGEHRHFRVLFFPDGVRDPAARVQQDVDDDLLATAMGKPIYGGWNDKAELWFPILEKAYGAFDGGGYRELGKGGNAFGIFRALLGAKPTNHQIGDLEEAELVDLIEQTEAEKWPTVAFTHGKDRADLYRGNRLKEWHTYSVLGVDRDRVIVRLYNPWGDTEYGSDGRDDGLFEMSVADFRKYFRNLNVAREPAI